VPHPLRDQAVVAAVESAATRHRGRQWSCAGFTDLRDRAAHPCGIFHGSPFSVFAKLSAAATGQDEFTAELAGLRLIAQRARVSVPVPVATGIAATERGWLLLSEALPEHAGRARTHDDFLAIGVTLASVHQVHGDQFGLPDFNGFFGPIRQDNRPVETPSWADFYAERRVEPMLRLACDSGQLPGRLKAGVERTLARLPELGGTEPAPSLLHGDAQQNNFLCTPAGAVVIDAAPYFGHPELDLALLDYFEPVPEAVFDGYRRIVPIDTGFADRRELWRIFGYLAIIACDGRNPFGRGFITRLTEAIDRYT
jgi:protein-ribulosamine 3-kinase